MAVNAQDSAGKNPIRAPAAQLKPALAVLTQILGAPAVRAEPPVLDRYARASGVHVSRPAAVVYPASAAEVQETVRAAARFGLTLHPVSRGCNWGYGDAMSVGDAHVIVDLRRMDRILEINHGLAYAAVEPGVTQGQLYEHLRLHHPDLWMDSSAGGPDTSLLANILERGFGHTRYGDHLAHAAGLEVVLPDGRLLQTGHGHFPRQRTADVFPYGVGPQVDGLFVQSSLGVVTRIAVWLMPRPAKFTALVVSCDEPQLPQLVDALGRLRMEGLLSTTVHLGNDLRVISGRMRYPFHRAAGQTPLPAELRRQLREEFDIGSWNASAAISGEPGVVRAVRRAVAAAFKRHRFRVSFYDQSLLDLGRRVQRLFGPTRWARRLGARMSAAQTALDLQVGRPTAQPLSGAAWRVRGDIPEPVTDPLDAHAGLLWIAPVVPLTGAAAREAIDLLEPIYNRHGFDALATFTLINPRAMICVTNLSFDRRDEDETQRAALCYHEALEATLRAGFPPYRVGPEGTDLITRHRSTYWELVDDLKNCIDPLHVFSRGRYARPGNFKQ